MFATAKFGAIRSALRSTAVPIAFLAAASDTANATTSITVTKPTGTADADHMVGIAWSRNAASLSSGFSGWTQRILDTATAGVFALYTKIAASEGADYTITFDASGDIQAAILAYRGGAGAVDVVGTPGGSASNVNPITAPGLTATRSGILIAAFPYLNGSRVISVAASGMTERVNNRVSSEGCALVYDQIIAAGATGDKSVTLNGTTQYMAAQIAIY